MAADLKVLFPTNGAPPVGPYSPGLETSSYVYLSGQGVRNAKSEMPVGIEAQTQQCVDNVRVLLEAAGLGFANVVSVQLYLADLKNLPVVEKIYNKAFTTNPPRVTLGVARMPTDTTVEITVVARKNVLNRVYLPAVYGSSKKDADAKLAIAMKQAGLTPKEKLFATLYEVGSREDGVVPVQALPGGATHATVLLKKAQSEDFAVCAVKASDPVGTIEEQTRNVFAKLTACLASQGMTLANIVATNVYVDDLNEFTKMNTVYATFFPGVKPTRTTVQPLPPMKSGSLIRISAVAAR